MGFSGRVYGRFWIVYLLRMHAHDMQAFLESSEYPHLAELEPGKSWLVLVWGEVTISDADPNLSAHRGAGSGAPLAADKRSREWALSVPQLHRLFSPNLL